MDLRVVGPLGGTRGVRAGRSHRDISAGSLLRRAGPYTISPLRLRDGRARHARSRGALAPCRTDLGRGRPYSLEFQRFRQFDRRIRITSPLSAWRRGFHRATGRAARGRAGSTGVGGEIGFDHFAHEIGEATRGFPAEDALDFRRLADELARLGAALERGIHADVLFPRQTDYGERRLGKLQHRVSGQWCQS